MVPQVLAVAPMTPADAEELIFEHLSEAAQDYYLKSNDDFHRESRQIVAALLKAGWTPPANGVGHA